MNTNRWRSALLCLALVAAPVAAACGDGDGDAAAGEPVGVEAASVVPTSTTAAPRTVVGDCVEGQECVEADDTPEVVEAPKVTAPEFIDFAAAADEVCTGMAAEFEALPGIHAEDGSVAPGLGQLMVEAAGQLGAVEAPPSISATWHEAIAAFTKTGEKFIEAEELLAAGDTEAAADAQNEALWVLPVEPGRLIASMGVPFQVCFIEE